MRHHTLIEPSSAGLHRRHAVARVVSATLFAVVMFAGPAHALEQDTQTWLNFNGMGRIGKPIDPPSKGLWYLEVQPRFSLSTSLPTVAVLRAAIGWELSPGVSAWAGFGAIPKFDAELRRWRPNELRLWQQVQLSKKYGPLQLVWRGRLEERFFEDSEGVAWRARSLLRGAWDLPGLDGRIALLLWDEPFVGLVGVNGEDFGAFDQNRAFVGGLLRLTPWAAVEVGYINVVLGDPFGPDGRMSHVAAASLALNVL